MSSLTKNVRQPFVALGILAVLIGLTSTGCSSSDPEAVVVQPAASAEPEKAKAKATSTTIKETSGRSTSKQARASTASQSSLDRPVPVVSAAEAGEDAYAVEDNTLPLTDADPGYNTMEHLEFPDVAAAPTSDECAMRWQEGCSSPNPALSSREHALSAPTDAELTSYDGILLPRIIPGMTVGMPYEQARQLILADGWRPADGLQPASRNGMNDYMEIMDCSGSGMGLCRMQFVDTEMNVFEVITGGSDVSVRDWTGVM